MKRTALLLLIVFLAGCQNRDSEKREIKQEQKQQQEQRQQQADAGEIYHLKEKNQIVWGEKSNISYGVFTVEDNWIYFLEEDSDETGILKRIHMHKDANGKEVLEQNTAEDIRNTRYMNGFTIAGNYFVGISYGSSVMLMDLGTKRTIYTKVPEEVAYSKKTEREDRVWWVEKCEEDQVIWKNDKGLIRQKIPSNEVSVIEKYE